MKITVDELLSLKKPINLIDIRDYDSYLQGHIPGAKNIISSELLYHTSVYLDYHSTYYVYCDVGYISEDICRKLSMRGYHVISIIGGYQNYLLKK